MHGVIAEVVVMSGSDRAQAVQRYHEGASTWDRLALVTGIGQPVAPLSVERG